MQGFFEALVRRRWLVMVLALGVVAGGWFNLRQLAIDAVPDISPKQVMILTEATGLGPLEVERLVSFPIETAVSGLPLLQEIANDRFLFRREGAVELEPRVAHLVAQRDALLLHTVRHRGNRREVGFRLGELG